MTHDHVGAGDVDLLTVLGPGAGLLALLAYGLLVARARRRGRAWPARRTLAWATGCVLAVVAVAGPLATASDTSRTAHMAGHVLLGMLAPLVLVLGAPVTLALNALPVGAARRLSHVLRSRPSRLVTEPAVAAVLAVGGLWILYGTPLLAVAHEHPLVDVVVHLHVLLSGYLFTAVLVGPDPLPHRRSTQHLLVVLVLALAAHDVLAKRLYAQAGGTDLLDEQRGALVMYYGGDAVDLALAVLVCARWYARARPQPSRPAGSSSDAPQVQVGVATVSPSGWSRSMIASRTVVCGRTSRNRVGGRTRPRASARSRSGWSSTSPR